MKEKLDRLLTRSIGMSASLTSVTRSAKGRSRRSADYQGEKTIKSKQNGPRSLLGHRWIKTSASMLVWPAAKTESKMMIEQGS